MSVVFDITLLFETVIIENTKVTLFLHWLFIMLKMGECNFSASEVTTIWRYKNVYIIIIIMLHNSNLLFWR